MNWKQAGYLHDEHNVKGFEGEYHFLSNFWFCQVSYNGLIFDSSEAAYQAAKCLDPKQRKSFVTLSAWESKYLGKKVKLRADWDSVKLGVMEDILRIKFSDPELVKMLIATGDKYLEETNWWWDRYWGVCKQIGENHLGKLLMKIRTELKTA